MNSLLSQYFNNSMFINIEINNKKKFKIKNIVNERKINCNFNKKL